MSQRIGIIGAGIAGLACGIELKRKGHQVKIFESTSSPGGRIKTDHIDGYLFDHGFQVFLPSYERAKYFLDYKKLKFKKFKPGALLQSGNSFEKISDPFRDMNSFFSTVKNSRASIKDKLLTLKLKRFCKSFKLNGDSGESTIDFLNNFGFSKLYIESFFKPFFAGVFLEKDLITDKNFFLYLFDKFSSASASLPEAGMQSIPLQMAEGLSEDELSLSNSVISIGRNSIISEKDAVESFDKIVVAVSAHSASKFLELPSLLSNKMHSVSTYYYSTTSSKLASKYLYLASNSKHINHVACLTAVNSSYAPKGSHLFSVNVINSQRLDSRFVTEDLKNIFPAEEVDSWKYMKSYHVQKALPKKAVFGKLEASINGIYVAGDFMQSPSIQGALESGYQVAQNI